MQPQIDKVVARLREVIPNLGEAKLGSEYSYLSLPLCVIDAVFSIGVRYESARRAVESWCAHQTPRWELFTSRQGYPKTVSDFLSAIASTSDEALALDVFQNRQRTSSRNGILKSEAVRRFAEALKAHRVDDFADVKGLTSESEVASAIRRIPGQSSGLSFSYFLMLGGSERGIKPDRMICRFTADAIGTASIAPNLAENLIRGAADVLRATNANISPRLLDHLIWNYQRSQAETEVGSYDENAIHWSAWTPFPDPRNLGILKAPIGPGVYELRLREGELILCGMGANVSHRMTSLLPSAQGGAGTRNNVEKRKFVAAHLPDIEYRTVACASTAQARLIERMLLKAGVYRFPT